MLEAFADIKHTDNHYNDHDNRSWWYNDRRATQQRRPVAEAWQYHKHLWPEPALADAESTSQPEPSSGADAADFAPRCDSTDAPNSSSPRAPTAADHTRKLVAANSAEEQHQKQARTGFCLSCSTTVKPYGIRGQPNHPRRRPRELLLPFPHTSPGRAASDSHPAVPTPAPARPPATDATAVG